MESKPKKSKTVEMEKFHTDEELGEAFDKCQKSCWTYEETCSADGVLSYVECYELLKRCEYHLINSGMFSPNEGIEEIHSENLR